MNAAPHRRSDPTAAVITLHAGDLTVAVRADSFPRSGDASERPDFPIHGSARGAACGDAPAACNAVAAWHKAPSRIPDRGVWTQRSPHSKPHRSEDRYARPTAKAQTEVRPPGLVQVSRAAAAELPDAATWRSADLTAVAPEVANSPQPSPSPEPIRQMPTGEFRVSNFRPRYAGKGAAAGAAPEAGPN